MVSTPGPGRHSGGGSVYCRVSQSRLSWCLRTGPTDNMGDQVHGTANSYDSSCCANRTTTGTLGPIYSHLAQRQAAGWQTGRGQERRSLRKAVLLMQPGMPGSPGWATLAPRVGINVPSLHTGRQKQSIPCQCSGLSSQSRASERGGLALMTKCSGESTWAGTDTAWWGELWTERAQLLSWLH